MKRDLVLGRKCVAQHDEVDAATLQRLREPTGGYDFETRLLEDVLARSQDRRLGDRKNAILLHCSPPLTVDAPTKKVAPFPGPL